MREFRVEFPAEMSPPTRVALDVEKPLSSLRTTNGAMAMLYSEYPSYRQDRLLCEKILEWRVDVDVAARMLASSDESLALSAVELLHRVVSRVDGPLSESALLVLSRSDATQSEAVGRRAFRALVPAEHGNRFAKTLHRFLIRRPGVLDDKTRAALCKLTLPEVKLEAFVSLAHTEADLRTTLDAVDGAMAAVAALGD